MIKGLLHNVNRAFSRSGMILGPNQLNILAQAFAETVDAVETSYTKTLMITHNVIMEATHKDSGLDEGERDDLWEALLQFINHGNITPPLTRHLKRMEEAHKDAQGSQDPSKN